VVVRKLTNCLLKNTKRKDNLQSSCPEQNFYELQMFKKNNDMCRAETKELKIYQWNRFKKIKNLKFLVPNTNGPFVGKLTMVYECLF
jgi:hypothetical protein